MKLSELLADIEVKKIIGAEQLNVTGIALIFREPCVFAHALLALNLSKILAARLR